MAWAEKLPSGRWRAVYRDARGRRRSAGTYPHKAAATRAAAGAEVDARKHAHRDPDAGKQLWGAWVETWWPTRAVEDSTRIADESRLNAHLKPKWEATPLGAITRLDVKAWAADLKAGGMGPASVQRCVHLLSASLEGAIDAEVLVYNAARGIKLPGPMKAQERYLTAAEYDAIKAQMPTSLDVLVLEVLVGTGMRPGEAAGLHWNRVDLDRGLVRVVEAYDVRTGLIKAYPKSKRVRDVPLEPEVVQLLRAEQVRRIEAGDDLRAGCPVEHRLGTCRSSLVLVTSEGTVRRMGNWSKRVYKPALEAAGVGEARLYDVRHTYASWLLQQGISLATVGQLLGHVSPVTTQIYAHLERKPDEMVVKALAAARRPKRKRPRRAS